MARCCTPSKPALIGLKPKGLVGALGSIGTDQAVKALGRLLAMPDDNTTNTLNIYESAVEALLKIDSAAAREELIRARSGPAATYVNARIELTNKERFKDNGDGTILDKKTRLVWQKEDDSTTRSHQEALIYCRELRLGSYSDWRLPTTVELKELFEDGSASSHPKQFTNAKPERYWSSEPYHSAREPQREFAYTVDFQDGRPQTYYAEYQYYVRAVRGPK